MMNRRKFLQWTGSAAAGAVVFPHVLASSALGAAGAVAPRVCASSNSSVGAFIFASSSRLRPAAISSASTRGQGGLPAWN